MNDPDDALEQRLRRVAGEVDPPPEMVLDAARAAIALRALDAELADLVADSWTDAEAVATRAVTADLRMLAFECGDVTVELEVETDHVSRTCRLHGVAVGDVAAVALVRPEGRTDVAVDASGMFAVDGVPVGPVRLELVRTDGSRVTTTWVML